MKTIKLITLLLLMAMSFGCSDEYNDSELRGRIENLETWQKTVNGQISALQGVVAALEEKDYVTAVTELADKSGYTITFSKSGPITIKHGQKGADATAPVVGVKKDVDGKYYWTLDGTFIMSGDKKIPTTGDKGDIGLTPQVRINQTSNEWEISTDSGATWTSTGVKATGADGDAIFARNGIDTSDSNNVTFTLADGTTKITLPRYIALKIGDANSAEILSITTTTDTNIALTLPSGFKESDYSAIMAEVKSSSGTSTDIKTRAISNPLWKVAVTKPTFTNGVYNNDAKVTVAPPKDYILGDNAILRITMINSNGNEIVSAKALKFMGMIAQGGQLSTIASPENVEYLTVTGTMTYAEFGFICNSMKSLKCLDLSGTNLTSIPNDAFSFNVNTGRTPNYKLKQIILPQSLKTINGFAFTMCKALKYIELPDGVTTLGQRMFDGCDALEAINIPSQVAEIPLKAFFGATGLTYIKIPKAVTTIGAEAFAGCTNIGSAIIEANITSIPEKMFFGCKNIASVIFPPTLISIGNSAFRECSKLEQVQFPGCPEKDPVQFPGSLTSIGEYAFSGCSFKALYYLPEGLLTLGEGVFSECRQLITALIPKQVAAIPRKAFLNCILLERVSIGSDDVTSSIGGEAFRGCLYLRDVSLPASITIVRDRAFQNCPNMRILQCFARTIPTLAADEEGHNFGLHFRFNEDPSSPKDCTLKVYDATAYSAWSTYFKEIINRP